MSSLLLASISDPTDRRIASVHPSGRAAGRDRHSYRSGIRRTNPFAQSPPTAYRSGVFEGTFINAEGDLSSTLGAARGALALLLSEDDDIAAEAVTHLLGAVQKADVD